AASAAVSVAVPAALPETDDQIALRPPIAICARFCEATCDSADIMYENYKYGLPLNLAIGDRMYWLSTGAYTTSYSAVEFNGFPPLKSYYL
ncbi:MAG: hypothetical protein RR740_12135, partial [Pseudomonas sp.]